MKKHFRILLFLLIGVAPYPLPLTPHVFGAQAIDERVIPGAITRDAEIVPTGEANAICVGNTGTPQPAITLCSTLALTDKTVLYKIPEYAFGSIPAGNPLVIVTNSSSAALCNGSGAIKAVCWHNGTSYVSLSGGGGVADPGANGVAVRSALNTLIARTLTGTSGRVTVANGDGVAGVPTFNTGSDVAHKSESNTFSATNDFTAKLKIPRKATPGDLGLIDNGEIFIDGELPRFKSNGGTVYTLFKFGDAVVRAFQSAASPTFVNDNTQGYLAGDIWINTTAKTFCVATDVSTGGAVWHCPGGGSSSGTEIVADTPESGFKIKSSNGVDYASLWWNASRGFEITCFPTSCIQLKTAYIDIGGAEPAGNCAIAAAAIPSGGYTRQAGTCADATGDEFTFGLTMEKGWDGGTVFVVPIAANVNASPTGTFTLAINGHCTPAGTARPALSTSNSQNASFTAWTAQYSEEQVSTPAITLLGTCTNAATEDISLDFRARVTAAPAQIADIKVLKFLLVYGKTRNSR